MNKAWYLLAAAAALLLSGPVAAQDAPPAEAATGDAAASAAEDTALADDTATAAEKALEKDLDRFWGERRAVKVVQKRLFEKDGRLELTPFVGIIPNDDFIVYYPMGMRAGYHFSEAFGVEASFAYALDKPSDLANFLEGEGIDLKRADIQEFINYYYGVDLLWAPIYGKISLLGMKLTHFETYVGLGFGIFHTKEVPATNPNGNPAVKPGGNVALGFRWFITDTLNVRTEYRQHFFQKFGSGVSIPVELSLGLGIII